jgi:hypothetical protein
MDSITDAATAAASSADLGTVQGNAALSVLKKALNLQASSAAQLIDALPQPALALSGPIGTQVNRYA